MYKFLEQVRFIVKYMTVASGRILYSVAVAVDLIMYHTNAKQIRFTWLGVWLFTDATYSQGTVSI